MNLLRGIKIKRTISKKEKSLLLLLGVVIFFWAAFRFIIFPQKDRLYELVETKGGYEEELFSLNCILKKEGSIQREWERLHKEEAPLINKYFSKISQPEIIYLLNEVFSNESIEALDMNFSRPREEMMGDLEISVMEVYVPYRAMYEGILQTIKDICSNPKKINISQLTLDKGSDEVLSGGLGLNIYGLEGVDDEDFSYKDIVSGEKTNPFSPVDSYDDIFDQQLDYFDGDLNDFDDSYDGDIHNVKILEDFEDGEFYFIPTNQYIKGNVSKSSNSKSNRYSVKFQYNILGLEEVNRANLELAHRDIHIKYPPIKIGLWVYAQEHSPCILGIMFNRQNGEKVELQFSKGLDWTGWQYLELTPPSDLSLYPLQIEKIYLELPYDSHDSGLLLLDGIEAKYSR